jgi:hypothetical protein
LFERNFPQIKFDSKYTELTINKTWVKVFPTKRIQDLRDYVDVSYLFIDEADYYDLQSNGNLNMLSKHMKKKAIAR